MVAVDKKIVGTRTDLFDDPRIARMLLGTVRYSESRFLSKPRDGDCRLTSLPDQKKLKAVFKAKGEVTPAWVFARTKRCPAMGPMQIAYDSHALIHLWKEGQAAELPARLTPNQLRDPETNVLMGYTILLHWKNASAEAAAKRTDNTPLPGVWLTAYRRGSLPPPSPKTVFHIDNDAKGRCKRMTHMMTELERLSKESEAKATASKAEVKPTSFSFRIPADFRCGHESKPAPKNIAEKNGEGTEGQAKAAPRE